MENSSLCSNVTANGKPKKIHWTEAETRALIQAWEDNLADLRRQKRNAGVYDNIVLQLGRLDIVRSRRQVITRIENLTQTYRGLLKGCTTGSQGISWPYFYEIHRFLGSLPVNDQSLVEECVDSPDVVEVEVATQAASENSAVPMDAGDTPSLVPPDMPSTSAGSASAKAGNKRGCISAGSEQPAKKKKVAEKQLDFMKRLLDEQRALRLCRESSRSDELSLRERQLALLEKMHEDFVNMREKMENSK